MGDGFNQFRVEELVEIELTVGEGEPAIMRLFLRSRTADQLAVEVPFSMWQEIYEALNAGLKKFPGGVLPQ